MACLFGHKWSGCKCEKCGKTRDEYHKYSPYINNHNHLRSGNDCVERCDICHNKKTIGEHSFIRIEDSCKEKCRICGFEKTNYDYHKPIRVPVECIEKCEICGDVTNYLAHNWVGCKCADCGESRKKEHNFQNGVCTICGVKSINVAECVSKLLALYSNNPQGFISDSKKAELVRAIGYELDKSGGFNLMLEAHRQFSSQSNMGRNLEMVWHGVGNWQG